MNSGSALVETRIPDGGFEIQGRDVKAADGGSAEPDCLAPKRANDELTVDRPLARQACLHLVLANCRRDQIVRLANLYGLLAATIPRKPESGKTVHADALPPEPRDTWHREIRALRAATELWDASKDRELVAHRITECLARTPFRLSVRPGGGGKIVLRYRSVLLFDAIWQQFAPEVAGTIRCVRNPAPKCGRWFVRSAGRSDRQYCSHACQMRFRRATAGGDAT